MKNYFYLVITLFVLFGCSVNAYSDCITGYACSLEELQKQEELKTKQNITLIQNYFKQNKPNKNFTAKHKTSQNYNDMFLFNSLVKTYLI